MFDLYNDGSFPPSPELGIIEHYFRALWRFLVIILGVVFAISSVVLIIHTFGGVIEWFIGVVGWLFMIVVVAGFIAYGFSRGWKVCN